MRAAMASLSFSFEKNFSYFPHGIAAGRKTAVQKSVLPDTNGRG